MATGIAYADGNFTGAATFAAIGTGSGASALIRFNTASLSSATTVTSSTFTLTNGEVIDAILLFIKNTSAAPTGTIKVAILKGGVEQAAVTVNKTDLANSLSAVPAPTLFKLTTTATGDGGSNWTIAITTSSATGIDYNRNSATGTDITRALRTTTAMTLAAGDNWFVVGELTGAGTKNNRNVTMDSTSPTDYCNGSVNSTSVYGGLGAISMWGTLTVGNSAATNYILRMSGDLRNYQNGTLDIGAMPRDSTCVFEWDQASASGDFGYISQGGTITGGGLSRTAGKDVVVCKLTADVSGGFQTAQGTTAGTLTSAAAVGSSGLTVLGQTFLDSTANSTHSVYVSGIITLANDTVSASAYIARGPGTNNRFLRFIVGNSATVSSITNGFYSDIDMQAGTAGTVTAVGTGTATSVSIDALGSGFVVRITGKINNSAGTTNYAHLAVCSAAGTTSFVGANNVGLILDNFSFQQGSAITDTTYNVNADCGWLAGDVVTPVSTTRSSSHSELAVLSANAGPSSFVTKLHPLGYPYANGIADQKHHGNVADVAGEVGLLTRNVKFRSTSSTLLTYMYFDAQSVVNLSWVEFYYMGIAAVTKRGLEFDTGVAGTVGAKNLSYCSMHSFSTATGYVMYSNSVNQFSLNLTMSNCVVFSSVGWFTNNEITEHDWTFEHNLFVRASFNASQLGGNMNYNTIVSANTAWSLGSTATAPVLGSFVGNVAHSCSISGLSIGGGASGLTGTIEDCDFWRNVTQGVLFASGNRYAELLFKNPKIFGNGNGITLNAACDALRIRGGIICGDSSFAQVNGISGSSNSALTLDINSVDFAGGSGIFVPHTTRDFGITAATQVFGNMDNCLFGAPTPLSKSNWSPSSYIAYQKYNQVAGDHRVDMTYGQIKTDTAIYDVAAPSMRLTPSSATDKLRSAPRDRVGKLYKADNGVAPTVSVRVRKSEVADGAAYNGNQPRLIQRANPALGQDEDIVIDTMSAAAGAFATLSGTGSVPTDDGAFDYIVDIDGTDGFVNVDNWA